MIEVSASQAHSVTPGTSQLFLISVAPHVCSVFANVHVLNKHMRLFGCMWRLMCVGRKGWEGVVRGHFPLAGLGGGQTLLAVDRHM